MGRNGKREAKKQGSGGVFFKRKKREKRKGNKGVKAQRKREDGGEKRS